MLDVPLPKGTSWPDKQMYLPRSKPDETKSQSDQHCPAYKNMNTAWWDSSQIYGSDEAKTMILRGAHRDGKLALDEKLCEKFLFRDGKGKPGDGLQ